MSRWAWVDVDAGAIEHNVAVLRSFVAPAEVWAVVKADGYGHGAVTAARAALAGGATGLCVALVQEGVELRHAGLACPILVLSPQPPEQMAAAVAAGLALTVHSEAGVAALEAVGVSDHPVHLKVDTGMHRVGASAVEAVQVAARIVASPATHLAAVFTHLAVADEPGSPFTDVQLARFDDVLALLRMEGIEPPLVHAANSAGAIAHPRARRDLVRAGIAIYGISPGPALDDRVAGLGLRPALSLRARVSHVKSVRSGEGISYGLRHTFGRDSTVATVPLGYADGVPRRLHTMGGEVLIGGVRRRITGVVTMDQLMVDCGDDEVAVGDEVVLLGEQGGQRITATDWADALGTIAYEVVCGLSERLERRVTTPGEG
ncbi:MAG: alanine racemase [Acidimicrobiaceae bacterium]|nr:alanine racemase [Acidimicrobiaceae bacterium]